MLRPEVSSAVRLPIVLVALLLATVDCTHPVDLPSNAVDFGLMSLEFLGTWKAPLINTGVANVRFGVFLCVHSVDWLVDEYAGGMMQLTSSRNAPERIDDIAHADKYICCNRYLTWPGGCSCWTRWTHWTG